MKQKENPIDSTTPGPFQKYLFSGACYVQIGECYKILKTSLNDGDNVIDNKELSDNLELIWNSFVTQLPCSSISAFSGGADDNNNEPWEDLENLLSEFSAAGALLTRDFLRSMNQFATDEVSLKQFFLQWAFSCDKAYQQLIYSDGYSKAIAKVVETAIQSPKTGQCH